MAEDPKVYWGQPNDYGIQVTRRSVINPLDGVYHAGRVNDVLIMPPRSVDAGSVLAGTDSGGIWQLFPPDSPTRPLALPLSDDWNDPNVISLAQAPDNLGHIYAGCSTTLYETDIRGGFPLGRWIDVAPNFGAILKVATLSNPNRIVVGTTSGVYWANIPAPGGAYNWRIAQWPTAPTFTNGFYNSVALGPQNTVLVAAFGNGNNFFGIFRGSWNDPSSPGNLVMRPTSVLTIAAASMYRVTLANVPKNPALVYALCSDATPIRDSKGNPIRASNAFLALLTFNGATNTWTPVTNPTLDGTPLVPNPSVDANGSRLPGPLDYLDAGHSNALAVSPNNSSDLIMGWLKGPYLSRDGGTTWKQLTDNALHADSNAVYFDPFDPNGQRFFFCSDGGIAETSDLGTTFDSSYNKYLRNLQFYSKWPTGRNFEGTLSVRNELVAGGLQDNQNVYCQLGNVISPWTPIGGCDGGVNAILATGQVLHDAVCSGFGTPVAAGQLSIGSPPQTPDPTTPPIRGSNGTDDKNGLAWAVIEPIPIPSIRNATGQLMYAVACPRYLGGIIAPQQLHGFFSNDNGADGHWEVLPFSGNPLRVDPQNYITGLGCNDTGSIVVAGASSGQVFRVDLTFMFAEELNVPIRAAGQGNWIARLVVAGADLFFAILTRSTSEGYVLRFSRPPLRFPFFFRRKWKCEALSTQQGLPGDGYYALARAFDGSLFVADDARVYVSRSNGNSWISASQNLPRRPHCSDLRYDTQDDGRQYLYLSTYGRSLWRADLTVRPKDPKESKEIFEKIPEKDAFDGTPGVPRPGNRTGVFGLPEPPISGAGPSESDKVSGSGGMRHFVQPEKRPAVGELALKSATKKSSSDSHFIEAKRSHRPRSS